MEQFETQREFLPLSVQVWAINLAEICYLNCTFQGRKACHWNDSYTLYLLKAAEVIVVCFENSLKVCNIIRTGNAPLHCLQLGFPVVAQHFSLFVRTPMASLWTCDRCLSCPAKVDILYLRNLIKLLSSWGSRVLLKHPTVADAEIWIWNLQKNSVNHRAVTLHPISSEQYLAGYTCSSLGSYLQRYIFSLQSPRKINIVTLHSLALRTKGTFTLFSIPQWHLFNDGVGSAWLSILLARDVLMHSQVITASSVMITSEC